jgi:hypothetical protein
MCVAFLPVGLPGIYSYYLSDKYFLPYNFAVPVPMHARQGPSPVPVWLYGTGTMVKHYGTWYKYTYCPVRLSYHSPACMTALYVRSIPTGNYYRYDMTVQYVQVLTDPW